MQYQITQSAIVILAAGQSSRLGSPKQLLQYNDKNLLQHSVDTAIQTNLPVIVVIGANSDLLKDELVGLNITIAENKDWKEGISTSLHCGLTAALNLNKEMDGIIFMVSDQPFVSTALLNGLSATQCTTGLPITASDYGNELGVPVLFHKFFFSALMKISGDMGARKLIQQNKDAVATVPFFNGHIDIDTKEDYEALLQTGNFQDKSL